MPRQGFARLSLKLGLFAGLLVFQPGVHQNAYANEYIAIGTGGPTGVYFVAGNAICRMVNKAVMADKNKSIRCSAPSTGGSVYNVNALRAGDLEMGVVQSDIQYHAVRGEGRFRKKPVKNLKALFSIHAEPFQILVGKNSAIKSWADLKGKRVNIGNPGSGQRATFEALMATADIDASYFSQVTELTSTEQSKALCDGNIDAYGYTVGVPNAGVAQAADGCGARIINMDTPDAEKLVSNHAYYAFTHIPRGTYSTTDSDIKTFGVKATVVATDKMSNETAYQIVKSVFDNLENFKKLHPAFAWLEAEKMIKEGNSAPLHPGAVRYYKEKGLM